MSETLEQKLDKKMSDTESKLDTREIEYPETMFVRDIENRVFQSLVLQCLSKIKGITLLEGNFIDNILGRDSVEGIKGIHTEQDSKNNSVNVRVEVNVCYGISIPEKADEVQTKITEEIIQLTGLHVSTVHVVFKNVLLEDPDKCLIQLRKPKEKEKELEKGVEDSPVLLGGHVGKDITREI